MRVRSREGSSYNGDVATASVTPLGQTDKKKRGYIRKETVVTKEQFAGRRPGKKRVHAHRNSSKKRPAQKERKRKKAFIDFYDHGFRQRGKEKATSSSDGSRQHNLDVPNRKEQCGKVSPERKSARKKRGHGRKEGVTKKLKGGGASLKPSEKDRAGDYGLGKVTSSFREGGRSTDLPDEQNTSF